MPRAIETDEARILLRALTAYGAPADAVDLAHTAVVRGDQRTTALALHPRDHSHVCVDPYGATRIYPRGEVCPTALALGATA